MAQAEFQCEICESLHTCEDMEYLVSGKRHKKMMRRWSSYWPERRLWCLLCNERIEGLYPHVQSNTHREASQRLDEGSMVKKRKT